MDGWRALGLFVFTTMDFVAANNGLESLLKDLVVNKFAEQHSARCYNRIRADDSLRQGTFLLRPLPCKRKGMLAKYVSVFPNLR